MRALIAGLLLAASAAHSPVYAGDYEVGEELASYALCVESSPVFDAAMAAVRAAQEADDPIAYLRAMRDFAPTCIDVRLLGGPVFEVTILEELDAADYGHVCVQYLRVATRSGVEGVIWTVCPGEEA